MEKGVERARSCAFTGHRPLALPWGEQENDPRCAALKTRLREAVRRAYGKGCRHFICGMAQGADFYFCEAVIELKGECPDVVLEGAVPFPGQSEGWSEEARRRYTELLSRCDMETLIQQFYSPTCMQRRNRYMVDHADCLIAVYNGDPKGSGTLNTLSYALKCGLDVEIIEV